MVTVSDKRISEDSDSDGKIDYYEADVVTANRPKFSARSSEKIGIAPRVWSNPSPMSPFEYAFIAGTIELAPETRKMKIGLQLSFRKNTVDGSFYMPLFNMQIKFAPYSFRKNHTTKAWNEKKHKKIIGSLSNEDSFGVMSKDNDLFSATETGSRTSHTSINIIQEKELFLPPNNEIETLIKHQGFIVGYLYDEDYAVVQSTAYSDNYNHRNYPAYILNSLKGVPYKINEFNEKQYDIRNNPGKMDLIGHCWLMAAYKMWFGKPFFEIVPKEKILSFKDAYEIKELEDGKVFVQLFQKIEESASDTSMEIQRKWREWLNFEKLIETHK